MLYTGDEKISCLYKYRKLYDDQTQELNSNTMKILCDQIIHFSKPSAFNDPFDIYIPMDFHCTEREFYDYYFKQHHSDRNMRATIRETGLSEMVKSFNNVTTEQKDEFIQKAIDTFKIFCMSKSDSNILLWSHYADCHKGISIGLKAYCSNENQSLMMDLINPDNNENKIFKHPLVHIEYQSAEFEYPIFRRYIDKIETMEKCFHMKAFDWKYEEEMRLLLWDNLVESQEIKLPEDSIKEVIFGTRTPPMVIDEVIAKMKDKNPNFKNIDFFKMKMVENRCALEKTSIKF